MKKQIKDYIDYDFHTPNTKEVRWYLQCNFELSGRYGEWENTHDVITPTYNKEQVYTTNTPWGEYISTEKFMELIGMTKPSSSNTFTKSDLKDGMICTNRSGSVYTVRGDRMVKEGGFVYLDDINDDLTISGSFGHIFDIARVEQPIVLFERYELKQQVIQKELEFAEAKKQRLEAHINVLKSKLK
jgi:hypothetical protein